MAGVGAVGSAVIGCAPRVYRVGFVNVGPPGPNAPNVAAFREGLRELGYAEGKNLRIDFHWAEGHVDRLPGLVSALRRHEVVIELRAVVLDRLRRAAEAAGDALYISM